jgi:hypothetical protein
VVLVVGAFVTGGMLVVAAAVVVEANVVVVVEGADNDWVEPAGRAEWLVALHAWSAIAIEATAMLALSKSAARVMPTPSDAQSRCELGVSRGKFYVR